MTDSTSIGRPSDAQRCTNAPSCIRDPRAALDIHDELSMQSLE